VESAVKAEYVEKRLCRDCGRSEHDDDSVQKPCRRITETISGVFVCTSCGRRVSRGFVVIYEHTEKSTSR
jgi:hypothetical protein